MKFVFKKIAISFFTILLLFPAALFAQEMMSYTRTADDGELQWGSCPEFMPESCKIAVLQGDPAKPNADIFFKMEGKSSVPNHWHHSAERMILVSGEMQVNYEGQNPETVTTGSYAYGPPEKPHTASCLSDEPCVLFIAFNKPVDAFLAK
jgi:quercetin dioxygenase-like cupin family protein